MNPVLYWKRHKTKTLGFLVVVCTAAHDNISQIRDVLSHHPKVYTVGSYILGLLVVGLGFLNSHQDRDDGHESGV